MKSFAARTRDALTRVDASRPDTRDARYAELTGLALSCGTVTLAGRGEMRLVLRTEHAGTGRRIVQLLRGAFSVVPGLRVLRAARLGGRTTYEIRLEGQDGARVMKALGLSAMEQAIPKHCTKSRRSRDAFLRGMFLGCGTVNDPAKGYQLSFNLQSERLSHSFARFLREQYAVGAGISRRRDTPTVFLHGGDDIASVLSAIGAYGAILDMENVRITKEARNHANRQANCDSGNITKMLSAADRQLQAIALIERTIGLDALPETLREVARERRLHADVSVETLGTLLEPPVGKSGVYHRLSRIEAVARSIAEKEKEEST